MVTYDSVQYNEEDPIAMCKTYGASCLCKCLLCSCDSCGLCGYGNRSHNVTTELNRDTNTL